MTQHTLGINKETSHKFLHFKVNKTAPTHAHLHVEDKKEICSWRTHAHLHVYMLEFKRGICTLKTQDHDALELNKGALLECKMHARTRYFGEEMWLLAKLLRGS